MAWATSSTPAITNTGSFKGKTLWSFMGTNADASTAIVIKAAPTNGSSLYITYILLVAGNDADAFPQIQDGDAVVLWGPFPNASGGATPIVYQKEFKNPMKVTFNTGIYLKCAAAGLTYVYVEGFTAT